MTTLRELTDGWFLYLTAFRSNSGDVRSKTTHDAMHAELQRRLMEMKTKAGGDSRLEFDFDGIRPVLVYFADEVLIYCCEWLGQETWKYDTLESREYEGRNQGGDHFFDLLEDEIKGGRDRSRLEIYLVCLTLGFAGTYRGDDDALRERTREVAGILALGNERAPEICPDAYKHTDDRKLELPPAEITARIVIVAAVGLLVIWLGSDWLFDHLVGDLKTASSEAGLPR